MTNSKTPGTRLTVIGLVNENEDISKDKYEKTDEQAGRSREIEEENRNQISRECKRCVRTRQKEIKNSNLFFYIPLNHRLSCLITYYF